MRPGTPGFIGARLREAREARSLTAISLAEVVGVTRTAVSQYEHGHQSPSPQVMRRISECLNLPIQFFLRKETHDRLGTVFYRSMSAATKRERQRAERRYGWFRAIVGFLRGYVRFPEVRFPDFELPADPTAIGHEQIEELAAETRRFWGLGTGPITNVTWLLENQGAVVARFGLGAATLDAFSEWDEVESAPYFVLGCDKASAVRSRYDAAHELGHVIMHRRLARSALNNPPTFKLIEAQADRFAGAFLLPSSSFPEDFYLPSLDGLRPLKAKWRVSIASMIKRAAHLNLISEDQERKLWINLSRRKWRSKEPLDDVLEPEEPRFVRRSVELLITKGIVAPNELPLGLALADHDIEELTGLGIGYLSAAEPNIQLRAPDMDRDEQLARVIPFPVRRE